MFNKILKKKEGSGFSLVEMVVAMGILTIFMPVIVGLMNSAMLARNTADVATKNIMNASTIHVLLTRDIESAGAIKVESPEHIKLRTVDNVCKDWKIENGSLMYAEKEGSPIIATDSWTTVYEKVEPTQEQDDNGINIDAFTYEDNALVYNFILGDEAREDKMTGSISPDVAATSPGNCWTGGE